MTQLLLIRHGQTTWNAERRLQGQQDAPLTEEGIRQAHAASGRLATTAFTAIYTSDLGRAAHTAEIINVPHRLELRQRADLREVDLGAWEGKTASELERNETEADLLAKWREDSVANRPPGGERLEELQARVIRALEGIAGAHPDGRVAVVTHGGVIKAAVSWVLGLPLGNQRRFEIGNGSITRLHLEPGRSLLVTLNDLSHWEGE
ncbi:MAG: histidine phosphatase family protein [Armatimonadetes bacterium]|nr:histidine phosphatase family protein [Armatimonadota bacterium]